MILADVLAAFATGYGAVAIIRDLVDPEGAAVLRFIILASIGVIVIAYFVDAR